MKRSVLSIIFCTTLYFTISCQSDFNLPVQTKIVNGVIEGNYDTKARLSMYFGIPYAKPPIGNLRWKAPLPVTNWTGIKPVSYTHLPNAIKVGKIVVR